ncbi:MAG TPA: SDR family NAD(P)-dependent oxidoreductase [Fibrobacter sp.]|nr:SDR family NAD(P)-dependent oxidoreductase [Fibrobacter sp.]
MTPKILVTGAAGFIGCETCLRLIEQGYSVVGTDNLNDYYSVSLKKDRLNRLDNSLFQFELCDLADKSTLESLFAKYHFERVIHLAAQAGVRYSLQNPQAYIDSNVTGFLNVLECCRMYPVKHLTYASSSSVYGRNTSTPFKTTDITEKPSSLYAATKKSNELMAETYNHLFQINATGLRFFTVYGPWGRPDMAPWLFAKAISEGNPIKIFNNGNMKRDFTYIDDIIEGVIRVSEVGSLKEDPEHKLYNIGRGHPIPLLEFVEILEENLGKKAVKTYLPMQPGDVEITWADVSNLEAEVGYTPRIDLREGISKFVTWFNKYYSADK